MDRVSDNTDAPAPRHGITLAAVNARYSHTAFALHWLRANLGGLRPRAVLREFQLGQSPDDIAETILADAPRIVALSVYIWNVETVSRAVEAIRAAAPEMVIVIGGPEAAWGYEGTGLFAQVDYLIRGEAEYAFRWLAEAILEGRRPSEKVIEAAPPDLASLTLPYAGYSDEDIRNRVLYVETSRGCPFGCEFCLSSRDARVREFPLESVLAEVDALIRRGARRLKFVDRTFNLRDERVLAVLDLFERHLDRSLEVHFEVVPDRLSPAVLERFARFPAGFLRLEVGVQTFTEPVLEAINRRQDGTRTIQVLRYLREETGALLHADLVAGLPGETWETFAASFDRLLDARPQEIQVGILKRLEGTPLAERAAERQMVFSTVPPYAILRTPTLDFNEVQRIKRFARYIELYYNAGKFPESLALFWKATVTPFGTFMAFSDYLWSETGRTHGLGLARRAEYLYRYMTRQMGMAPAAVEEAVRQDYFSRPGRSEYLDLS